MNLFTGPSCRRTLLVISSDKANMQLMTQLIATRDDLDLLTATNCTDGMRLAGNTQPKVVVLDTGPDICATVALMGLLENHLTMHIPIIAVSADAQPTQIQAGLQAGFYRYLTKPYKLTDLLDAIDSSLSYSLGKSKTATTHSAH